MSVKSLKNKLLAFTVVGAFIIAQPEFAHSEEPLLKGFYLHVEGRYLFSDGDELPHSISIAAITNADGPSILNMGDFEGNSTVRSTVGFHFGENWDAGISYSGLKVSKEDGDHPDLFPLVGNGLNPNVIGYCPGGTGYYCFVGFNPPGMSGFDHTSRAEYHVVDFEVGYTFKLGQIDGFDRALANVDVRVFGGLRHGEFDQGYNFSLFNLFGGSTYLQRDVHAEGIGPRLGVTGNLPLGLGGFSLTGSVSGSALFGDRDTVDTLHFLFQFRPDLEIFSSADVPDDTDTFYNAEGEIGLSYALELGNASSMMMTLGYRAEGWFGVNNTQNSFALGVGSFNTVFPVGTTTGDDDAKLFFHGPFMRGSFNF